MHIQKVDDTCDQKYIAVHECKCVCVMCVLCVSVRVRTCVLAVDTWSRDNMTQCIDCLSVRMCFTVKGEQGTCPCTPMCDMN